MKTIPFWKMSGSGNDFIVIDNRRRRLSGERSEWAKRLCFRQEGVGADGLLLLERSPRADFRMVYYNADGSRAGMCGNGARCMAYFAQQQGVVGHKFHFETDAYPVDALVRGNVIRIAMADPKDYRAEVRARVDGKIYWPAFINTGVPHAVVFVPDVRKVNVPELGRALRFHPAFGPKGTNVDFVQRLGPNRLRVRTYERGVEAETLACGTGVTAAALATALRGLVKSPVQCVTNGGDTLEVNFDLSSENGAHPASRVTLRGRVRVTFKGEFHHR